MSEVPMDKKEFAYRARISVTSLNRMLRRRQVGYLRSGRRVYFSEKHLQDYLKSCERPAKVPLSLLRSSR